MTLNVFVFALLLVGNCKAQHDQQPCPNVYRTLGTFECQKTDIWIPTSDTSNTTSTITVLATDSHYSEEFSVKFIKTNDTYCTLEIIHPSCSNQLKIRKIIHNGVNLCETNFDNSVRYESVIKIKYVALPRYTQISVVEARAVWNNNVRKTLSRKRQNAVSMVRQCGKAKSTLQLIHGGSEVALGDFPWVVALYLKVNYGLKYKCTGSIVSKRFVLTAGHCLQLSNTANDYRILYGYTDLSEWTYNDNYVIVQKIFIHDGYQHGKPEHDVALLNTQTIRFYDDALPVCLPVKKLDVEIGTVAGWGSTERGNKLPSTKLKGIDIQIVSYDQCVQSKSDFASLVKNNTFCAGRRDGTGPCGGDSGAPLFQQIDGAYFVIGVVSTALKLNDDCDLNNYIIFVDVEKELNWIRSIMY